MEIDYKALMESKSEEGLRKYISEASKYKTEAIQAAIHELKSRGLFVSDVEIQTVNAEIERKKLAEIAEIEEEDNPWGEQNITGDVNSPHYYSRPIIWIFCVVFTTLAGSLLLVSNIKKSHKKEGLPIVLTFGILYTVATIWAINTLKEKSINPSGLPFLFNAAGGFVLDRFFWMKYIGKDTKYRAKTPWIHGIIWVVISLFLIWVMMSNKALPE